MGRGNEIADDLARDRSVQKFVGPELPLRKTRRIRKQIRNWFNKLRLAKWRGLRSTQGQDRDSISGPNPYVKSRNISFNIDRKSVV